jgi:hypothetical protein
MIRRAVALASALLLAGCGTTPTLRPAPGETLPVAPYGAPATPDVDDLLTPSTQARPQRSDEVLLRSEKRRSDEFDLPPQ